jgi:glycerol-3-phosphate dehydrogenase
MMKICVVGGGINGLCCAWVLAQKGHDVHLIERGKLGRETSQASSKLLHGGLRYLEQGNLRLVRESLRERDGWLQRVPTLVKPLRLVLPIYQHSRRSRWLIGAGLFLYDHLAGRSILPGSTWLTVDELLQRDPYLQPEGLKGGYAFSDGQMDDYQLALWVAEQAKQAGVQLTEDTAVEEVDTQGAVHFKTGTSNYDRVVNVCGPWAGQLLEKSGIPSPYRLDTVRGSHLIIGHDCLQAYLLEVPDENRIFFVLPWQGKTLVGTTEIRQKLDDPIECSVAERDYLLKAYNHYRTDTTEVESLVSSFAGVRPLLYSASDPNRATREYAIERTGKLVTVFGGKWTTALALARNVSQQFH